MTSPVESLAVDLDVEVPMRDGAVLRADVYRPGEGRWPALLSRTPYGKSLVPGLLVSIMSARAARAGYAVVVQDTRGRGISEGEFTPFVDEARDGYDTVAWVARQPWCDGQVAMFGSSYMGATQLQAAGAAPPALRALAPVQASSDYYEGRSYRGGALELGALATISLWALGPGSLQRRIPDPREFHEAFAQVRAAMADLPTFLAARPLESLRDTVMGEAAPFFFDWLEHDEPDDEYWHAISLESRYEQIGVPALHVTSWYDQFHVGTLRNFEALRQRAATLEARDAQALIVGPWTHYPPRTGLLGSARVGDINFGTAAIVDLETVQLAWFDKWLKGSTAWRQRAPARIFVMGANRWRDEDGWPLQRAEVRPLHLDGADGEGGAGSLTWALPAVAAPRRYRFDPGDPVPTRGGAHLVFEALYPCGPIDQGDLADRPDVLTFRGPVLDRDLEVTGWVGAELWVRSSAPSTDFTVKLVDVHPDGRAFNVVDGIRRVRFADESLDDGWARITVDLGATAMVFLRGHALRVDVSSSNFPRHDVNPNTGGTSRTESATAVAQQEVASGGRHASRLLLPVVPT